MSAESYEDTDWAYESVSSSQILRSECPATPTCSTCPVCVFRSAPQIAHLTHVPEMIFHSNRITITHAVSGASITFSALEALAGIAATSPEWAKVSATQQWRAARQHCPHLENEAQQSDWTFSTSFAGSLADASWRTEPTTEGLDLQQLRQQEPILFYSAFELFEDELGDHGVSQCNVRFRAMASGWFLLMRHYLRVDRVCVRVRDTRLRWRKAQPDYVLREISLRHADIENDESLQTLSMEPDKMAASPALAVLEEQRSKLLWA